MPNEVDKRGSNLNKALEEATGRPRTLQPEALPDLVRLEEVAFVELLDPVQQDMASLLDFLVGEER